MLHLSANPKYHPEHSRSMLSGSVDVPDAAVASAPPPQRLKWWGALIIGLGSSLFLLLTGLFMLWLCWQRSSTRLANEEVRPPHRAVPSGAAAACACQAYAHRCAHRCRMAVATVASSSTHATAPEMFIGKPQALLPRSLNPLFHPLPSLQAYMLGSIGSHCWAPLGGL